MKTWLFVWEFGAGLGHLRRLGLIANALANAGDRVVACVPSGAAQALFPAGTEWAAIPALPAPLATPSGAGFLPSYGAALVQMGFSAPDYVAARLAVWDQIFADVAPSAMIADHAPFAVFAARGRVPAAVIGTGLDLPPAQGEVFPTILPNAAPFDESGVLDVLKAAARHTRRPSPMSVPAALRGDLRLLAGLPAFDPYIGRRLEPHLGPLGKRPAVTPCPSEGFVFAYLRSDHPSFEPLTLALAQAGLPGCVHWQGPRSAGHAALLEARGLAVSQTPVNIELMMAKASLVISLGGSGLTGEALYAGRPHLIFPIHLESELNAQGLQILQAGRRLSAGGLSYQIELAADELSLRDGALKAGIEAHDRFGEDPADRIAAKIRALSAA